MRKREGDHALWLWFVSICPRYHGLLCPLTIILALFRATGSRPCNRWRWALHSQIPELIIYYYNKLNNDFSVHPCIFIGRLASVSTNCPNFTIFGGNYLNIALIINNQYDGPGHVWHSFPNEYIYIFYLAAALRLTHAMCACFSRLAHV